MNLLPYQKVISAKKVPLIGIRECGKKPPTFDSWIILVDKMTLDELDREGRLSDTWQWRRLRGRGS